MIKISKVIHRDRFWIKVLVPYNQEYISKLHKIKEAVWSCAHKAWLLPYTKEAFSKLKILFPDLVIDQEKKDEPDNGSSKAREGVSAEVLPKKLGVEVEVIGRKILLRMPKRDIDIKFVLTLRYSRWDKGPKVWVISNYSNNLELIKEYFKERITTIIVHKEAEVSTKEVGKLITVEKEVLVILTQRGRLKIICRFNQTVSKVIKSFPYWRWDSKNKWWTLPYSETILRQLEVSITEIGWSLRIANEGNESDKTARKSSFETVNYRSCPEAMLLKLRELRYSERTVKAYKSLFEEFINHYPTDEIDKIGEQKIVAFCRYLVIDRRVSASYQNQAINAIKFYYEKVMGGQRRLYRLDRPQREKTLPTVLSLEEVSSIFKAAENLKHKTILVVIYSAGLRIGELINLKIKDIDSQRMQIRVEQAKGRKDRYTLLSFSALKLLRVYFKEYQPREFLFTGREGGAYSSRSIQAFFKEICTKAGIKKAVTVHTLRHSFATHLLESGTDLRYIQSLLGHESSKTTEIYTHITTKGFDQIKNPLDGLDI